MPKLAIKPPQWVMEPGLLTPIEQAGNIWLKRDDLFLKAGCRGGKVRVCWELSQGAKGLVTAGARQSPQMQMVARIAALLRIPCRCHTATGEFTPEMVSAADSGAEIVQHAPGYNSVICARARVDALERGWREIPFGMECPQAVDLTAKQVAGLPGGIRRIVIAVGSGMALCGVLHGLRRLGLTLPVTGIVIGANPMKRIRKYAPPVPVELLPAGVPYERHVTAAVGGVDLDPVYESKAARFLRAGDLFWVVGRRGVTLEP